MMATDRTKARDFIVCAAISFIVCYSGIKWQNPEYFLAFLPVCLTACLPVIFLTAKYGYGMGLGCALLAFVYVLCLAGVHSALMYAGIFGLSGAGLGFMLRKGFKAAGFIFSGGALLFVLLGSWVAVEKMATGRDVLEAVKRDLGRLDSVEEFRSEYEKIQSFSCAPGVKAEAYDEKLIEKITINNRNFLKAMFALMFLSSAGAAGLLYLVCLMVFPDLGVKVSKPARFSAWRPPEGFIWVLTVGLAAYLYGGSAGNSLLETAGYDAAIAVLFAYLINGLSVVSHFFNVLEVPLIIKVIGYLFILRGFELNRLSYSDFSMFSSQLPLLCIGISDVWIDYRKRVIAIKEKEI